MTTLTQTTQAPDDFGPAPGASGATGALAPLLDVRFTRFITVRIVQALYLVGIGVISLYTFAGVIAMFRIGFVYGLLGLILAPVIFLLSVLVLRVCLEVIAVLFRIAENTSRMTDAAERAAGA